jgi:SAM-dependent methyltransferase
MASVTDTTTSEEIANAKEYYGKILTGTDDLKTSACCSMASIPEHHREILKLIDDEILDRVYGCGSPIPPAIEGCTVLDLGCGTGRDAYLASRLVGETGRVIGLDMTDEQLAVARKHVDGQMERFGYKQTNVDFRKGYIEDLAEAGIEDASVDLVISNCVINLSPDKGRVLREIWRVLKPGGELYFSDVYADRRVPAAVKADPVMHGECLGGALYVEDFRRIMRDLGCLDYRVTGNSPIEITDPDVLKLAGDIRFCSLTIRAFKLDSLEDICEDFGQEAVYRGTMPGHPRSFELDDHHHFQAGKPMLVCGNTAAMLGETRYAEHFDITGDRSVHYGPFDCSTDGINPCADDAASCC